MPRILRSTGAAHDDSGEVQNRDAQVTYRRHQPPHVLRPNNRGYGIETSRGGHRWRGLPRLLALFQLLRLPPGAHLSGDGPCAWKLGSLEPPEDRHLDEIHQERERRGAREQGSDDDHRQRCHGEPSVRQRRGNEHIDH